MYKKQTFNQVMKLLPIWQCRKTGECCKRFISSGPRIQKSENQKIIEYLDRKEIADHLDDVGVTKEEIESSIKNRGSLPLQNESTCVFLKNDECLIHDVKPEVCQTYPLMIDRKSNKTKITVDLTCPRGEDLVKAIKNRDIPTSYHLKEPIEVEGRYFYEDLIREKYGEDA